MMHIMLARLRGAGRVIVSEVMDARLAQAGQTGADRVVNPAQEDLAAVVLAESGGEGADVIIVAAPSHAAQQQALQLAAIGGASTFLAACPKTSPPLNLTRTSSTTRSFT